MLLALSLSGAGSHPAAQPPGGPLTLSAPAHWVETIATVDAAPIDLVTIADGSAGARAPRLPRLPRLDATMIACRLGPLTSRVGLLPEIATASTEPFLVSSQLATLDFVSDGRAGWLLRSSASGLGVARSRPEQQHAEAFEHVEIVRRLWDSWEDDAEIRDEATNRFIDRERVHHIDYEGRMLAVKGPSITPRPPQGQPVIAVEVRDEQSLELAAAHADVVFLAADRQHTISSERIAEAVAGCGRDTGDVRVLADLPVALDDEPGRAHERVARLDALVAADWAATAFIGGPSELAKYLNGPAARDVDGFRLHPADLDADLPALLVAATQLADDPTAVEASTLRDRLGLPRPANRYAPAL